MRVIDSFEVVTLHGDGEIVLTTNQNDLLSHQDGQELSARIESDTIIVNGVHGFRLEGVPGEAIEYLKARGKIDLAEMSQDKISRIAILVMGE